MTVELDAPPNPFVPGKDWNSHRFIADEVMDDQIKSQVGMMYFGMSDLGECLEAVRLIRPEDEESWITAWTALAERIQDRAEAAELRGRQVTAADGFLRAATYWRASLMHFSYHDDPRVKSNAISAYRCYDRYLDLGDYPGEYVRIPYEDSFLPSYLYRSRVARGPAPLLIFFQGRDAWPEDTRWVYDGAIRRGYHCLSVQCPGQGMALRVNGLPFRPDWENVVTPIVDVAVDLDGVDPGRIGLMGSSFGGYLAPRAVVHEKRIKTCIANPGVLQWGASLLSHLPGLQEALDEGPDAFNAATAQITAASSRADWFIRDSTFKHGVKTPYELFKELQAYDLTDHAAKIECETLIMDGTEESFQKGQAQQLYDLLTCPKELLILDGSTTAQLHCQNGASGAAAEFTFEWLDDRL